MLWKEKWLVLSNADSENKTESDDKVKQQSSGQFELWLTLNCVPLPSFSVCLTSEPQLPHRTKYL